MSDTTTDIRQWVYADKGPVADAVSIIATGTTLAQHVTVHPGEPLEVEVTDSIPFELWGSGTQALWLLVCSLAYSAEAVHLYRVASTLDSRNSATVAQALAVYFGGAR